MATDWKDICIALGSIAAAGILFLPLHLKFLSPAAKRLYLPVPFVATVTGMQILLFYDLGPTLPFFFLLVWSLLGVSFVIGKTRVCPDCGTVVGLSDGRQEHTCPNQAAK